MEFLLHTKVHLLFIELDPLDFGMQDSPRESPGRHLRVLLLPTGNGYPLLIYFLCFDNPDYHTQACWFLRPGRLSTAMSHVQVGKCVAVIDEKRLGLCSDSSKPGAASINSCMSGARAATHSQGSDFMRLSSIARSMNLLNIRFGTCPALRKLRSV
ncbi:hypothetical protein [Pseudomonas sp. BN515]|uniref:hypothetical protein n=1 Tax=Pseudomonas sp. BN515 TaxID=2567892 RepID=UPI00245882D4|nr:hypothetical protein [Pseudomonas sp. BN515]